MAQRVHSCATLPDDAMSAGYQTRTTCRGSNERAAARLAELLVLPGWVLILAVFALPVLGALYLSFRNETLGGFMPPRFVGFDNYRLCARRSPLLGFDQSPLSSWCWGC